MPIRVRAVCGNARQIRSKNLSFCSSLFVQTKNILKSYAKYLKQEAFLCFFIYKKEIALYTIHIPQKKISVLHAIKNSLTLKLLCCIP